MNYKISVLVAAYNAERYLRECLDSLINQTLREIQIICVDDASQDNTFLILKEYQSKDKRITVLQQTENQGQAKARNRGLEIATGEFITILDSDDWLAPDALERAYQITRQFPRTDAVLLDVIYYYQSTGKYAPYDYRAEKKMYTGQEALHLSLDWRIHGLYIVRNSIHKAYPYDTFSRMYSDDNTTRFHYLHSREVRFSTGIYYYRQHAQSNTTMPTVRQFDFMDAGLSLKCSLQKEKVDSYIVRCQENLRWIAIVGLYIYYLQTKNCFSTEERQDILNRFRYHIGNIDISLLDLRQKYKFGYIPFKGCFVLFQMEVRLYHEIRKSYYRLKRLLGFKPPVDHLSC